MNAAQDDLDGQYDAGDDNKSRCKDARIRFYPGDAEDERRGHRHGDHRGSAPEGPGQGHDAVSAHPAEGGAQAGDAATYGWLAG